MRHLSCSPQAVLTFDRDYGTQQEPTYHIAFLRHERQLLRAADGCHQTPDSSFVRLAENKQVGSLHIANASGIQALKVELELSHIVGSSAAGAIGQGEVMRCSVGSLDKQILAPSTLRPAHEEIATT